LRPSTPAVRSAARFALATAIVTALVLALVAEKIAAAGWTLLGGVLVAGALRFSGGLLRSPYGTPLPSPGAANRLTVVRFVWIAPVCALMAGGARDLALALYILLGLTDIVDGIVARVRHERTLFGVVLDPVADVLSTLALFTVFLVDNLIPLWLYLLLAARYVMLAAGAAVLTRRYGPIPYRATLPGKVVGVVQAAGAGLIILGKGPVEVVFAVLGLGFAWVIVSQGLIGRRHIRNATRGRTTQGGSSR